jgi:hypothetical protein
MLTITTLSGKVLQDQRGVYLYDGRAGQDVLVHRPADSEPIRYTVDQMIARWISYCEYGSYELRLW